MKKNLLMAFAIMVAGVTKAQVTIDWSVEEVVEPTEFQTAVNGTTPVSAKFVLKNNGPDSAIAGDTILYQLVIRSSTNQLIAAIPNGSLFFRVLDRTLRSGDTIHQTWSGTLNVGATRSININFSALSYITNRSRGLNLELAAGGTTGNNTKIKGIVWKMIGGYGVSVSDVDADVLNVYPTVVDKFVTVDLLVSQVNTNTIVSFFDLQGKEVATHTLTNATESIDVSKLNSGVYIMKVNNGSESYTAKIVKN